MEVTTQEDSDATKKVFYFQEHLAKCGQELPQQIYVALGTSSQMMIPVYFKTWLRAEFSWTG